MDHAPPSELMSMEQRGIDGRWIKAMAEALRLPISALYQMLGLPKATIEKKIAADEPIAGVHGIAALGMARLLATAQNIAASSTAAEAKDFDIGKWLGAWLLRPQPSLGGKRPADFLDTPTGSSVVLRLLGAVESGAYL